MRPPERPGRLVLGYCFGDIEVLFDFATRLVNDNVWAFACSIECIGTIFMKSIKTLRKNEKEIVIVVSKFMTINGINKLLFILKNYSNHIFNRYIIC